MIKINVILSNPTWKKYIKSPNNFINNKIFLINKKEKFYKKKKFTCSLLLSGAKEIQKLNKNLEIKISQLMFCLFHFMTRKI